MERWLLTGAAAVFVSVGIMQATSFAQTRDAADIVYDTEVVRPIAERGSARAATPSDSFDVAAFMNGGSARSGPAPGPDAVPDAPRDPPLLVPQDLRDAQSGRRSVGARPQVSDEYFMRSPLGGAAYGYATPIYSVDVTARVTTTVPAAQRGDAAMIPDGRFPLERTRTGWIGTINAANVSYLVEISCREAERDTESRTAAAVPGALVDDSDVLPACLADQVAERVYNSMLECDTSNSCYAIRDAG